VTTTGQSQSLYASGGIRGAGNFQGTGQGMQLRQALVHSVFYILKGYIVQIPQVIAGQSVSQAGGYLRKELHLLRNVIDDLGLAFPKIQR